MTDPLIAMGSEWRQAKRALDKGGLLDRDNDKAGTRFITAEARIAEAQPTSIAGAIVIARVLADFEDFEHQFAHIGPLARNLLAGLEAMDGPS